MAMEQFPRFSDGNVEITIGKSGSKLYSVLLHSHVLALHLQWFKASLSERWSGRDDGNFLQGTQQHWEYELRFDKGSAVGILLPAHAATADTDLLDPSHKDWEQLDAKEDRDLFNERVYVAQGLVDVLELVYHIPISQYRNEPDDSFLGRPEKWLAALHEAGRVYGCEQVVGPVVDQYLSRDQKAIVQECRSEPVALQKVALRYRTSWVFREAAAHLIGSDQPFWLAHKEEIKQLGIAKLLNRKRREFVKKLKETELELFKFNVGVENGEEPNVSPLASAFFQAWLTKQLKAKQGSGLEPGYAEVYRRIWSQEYVQDFSGTLAEYLHSLQPHKPWPSDGDIVKLADSLHVVLPQLKGLVKDIMRKTTAAEVLDSDADAGDEDEVLAPNLTFMEVKDEELPWS
ncbi:hypothetical protein LTR09_008691 [Extremus antarcticus]|uniref:BTB domain-containing protein n=1 Tax=Extremus antarcticus TaxID=702011 RepID=A0AAJ0DGT0_9PEZI|nr:hypothetical protein LTR09_008691 [Extremus antarcticus]